ncbi:MAG: hypothetical protein WA847_02755, partial [Terriglobales bacterium]
MPKPLPPHPDVRNCSHIKVTGQRCGSPALRGEFFCYFHTRVIKGVQQRVDMQLHSMARLEDCESIQLSIMHVVDGLIKGTLDAAHGASRGTEPANDPAPKERKTDPSSDNIEDSKEYKLIK